MAAVDEQKMRVIALQDDLVHAGILIVVKVDFVFQTGHRVDEIVPVVKVSPGHHAKELEGQAGVFAMLHFRQAF